MWEIGYATTLLRSTILRDRAQRQPSRILRGRALIGFLRICVYIHINTYIPVSREQQLFSTCSDRKLAPGYSLFFSLFSPLRGWWRCPAALTCAAYVHLLFHYARSLSLSSLAGASGSFVTITLCPQTDFQPVPINLAHWSRKDYTETGSENFVVEKRETARTILRLYASALDPLTHFLECSARAISYPKKLYPLLWQVDNYSDFLPNLSKSPKNNWNDTKNPGVLLLFLFLFVHFGPTNFIQN